MNLALVITAYNREDSLKRLLESVGKANYAKESRVDLIISIDYSGSDNCYYEAKKFEWLYGEKRILNHGQNLGLKKHIISCGDLVQHYDGIIMLEDDIYVSPEFYNFSKEALEFYKNEKKVSQVSLYSMHYNETARLHFEPMSDASDVFFMQLASSWGQVWLKEWWEGFKSWLGEQTEQSIQEIEQKYLIPPNVIKWPATSWKKLYIYYMIVNDKYCVYPFRSFSTNFMDKGTHHLVEDNLLQVPLELHPRKYIYRTFDESKSKYDAFCEMEYRTIRELNKKLINEDVEVDLYGTKPLEKVSNTYVLSTRKVDSYISRYSINLKPIEMNVVLSNKSHKDNAQNIYLSLKNDVKNIRPKFIDSLCYFHNVRNSEINNLITNAVKYHVNNRGYYDQPVRAITHKIIRKLKSIYHFGKIKIKSFTT